MTATVGALSELVADARVGNSFSDEDCSELSCLSDFRTKLLQGTGTALLVEDGAARREKRVCRHVRNPARARPLYQALASLHRHPHICRVHELIPLNDQLVVLSQFASHGSLRALLSYLPGGALHETNARLLFQQLIMAVDYLVRKGITEFMVTLDTCFMHRDGCFPARASAHRLATSSTHRFTQTGSDLWRTLELDDPPGRPPPPTPRRPTSPDDLNHSDLRLLLDPRPLGDPLAPAASLLRHPALHCPPEVLRGGRMGEAGLVWMLGVVLHCMLTGSYPCVRAATWAAAMRAPADEVGGVLAADVLTQAPLAPHTRGMLSPGATQLLCGLLEREPARRVVLGGLFNNQWVAQGAPMGAVRFNDSLLAMGNHR